MIMKILYLSRSRVRFLVGELLLRVGCVGIDNCGRDVGMALIDLDLTNISSALKYMSGSTMTKYITSRVDIEVSHSQV